MSQLEDSEIGHVSNNSLLHFTHRLQQIIGPMGGGGV